jgi:SPP1 family predicted phage head-tail adaptor
MRAGPLDRRATLQSPVVSSGAAGDVITGYVTVAEVWAGKRDLRGRELLAAGATMAEQETMIVIRWRADLRPAWRVLMDGRTYDIQAAAELGRRDGLELRCIAAAD